MAQPIRKSLSIPVGEIEVEVPITFEVIEIVERAYGLRAEYVASRLERPTQVLRHQVAEVITDWVSRRRPELSRMEIRGEVISASPAVLGRYVGCIQAAVLYTLKEIDGDEADTLAQGKDLPDAKKKPDPTPDSSTSATP